MAEFTYMGDSARVFPDWSLEVEPGDVVDVEANPDPHFFAPAAASADPETPTPDAEALTPDPEAAPSAVES